MDLDGSKSPADSNIFARLQWPSWKKAWRFVRHSMGEGVLFRQARTLRATTNRVSTWKNERSECRCRRIYSNRKKAEKSLCGGRMDKIVCSRCQCCFKSTVERIDCNLVSLAGRCIRGAEATWSKGVIWSRPNIRKKLQRLWSPYWLASNAWNQSLADC